MEKFRWFIVSFSQFALSRKRNLHLGAMYFIVAMSLLPSFGCNKSAGSEVVTGDSKTVAEKIAGTYSGTGKYLPGDIDLGTTPGCSTPPVNYSTKYQAGSASVNITKLTDSSVKMVISSSSFPQAVYSNVTVKEVGDEIVFYSGSYDIITKQLLISSISPRVMIIYGIDCGRQGYPYFKSTQTIGPTPPIPGPVVHKTIERYEFSGE